ncbi:MAG: protein kinase [Oscillospiraceae bacterium]|nr:protein kinase [Oscillospiraceae bacterium]
MEENKITKEETLLGSLSGCTPADAIILARHLCRAASAFCENGSGHGSIWPGNITRSEQGVELGEQCTLSPSEMDPSALEFIAPEQFWTGVKSPASDVYSIGLILYTMLNEGLMPFSESENEEDTEKRAENLRRRMKGEAPAYPRLACRELAELVLKAIAYNQSDRFSSPAELRAALEDLPEIALIPAAAPIVALTSEEAKNAKTYKVDKDFENTADAEPIKTKKRRGKKTVDEDMDVEEFRKSSSKGHLILTVVLLLLFVGIVLYLLNMAGFIDLFGKRAEEEQKLIPDIVIETPEPVDETPEPETGSEDENSPDDTENGEDTAVPEAEPVYEIFVEDVTWEQAKTLCESKGGHLATVKNEEQFAAVTKLALEKGVRFVWLGALRQNGQWYYVTGEQMSFAVWDTGEPSAFDSDGTAEDYLLLWRRTANAAWTYNDMRNNPIAVVPGTYSGKTAYICQYDNVAAE